jgi:hypothetical protein
MFDFFSYLIPGGVHSKIKVKFVPVIFLTEHYSMKEGVLGSGDIVPRIL